MVLHSMPRSHPTWVRGLKRLLISILHLLREVAPYVGAWIETLLEKDNQSYWTSHPTWVRGLKHCLRRVNIKLGESHPTWVRGLKHVPRIFHTSNKCRTLRGCVD